MTIEENAPLAASGEFSNSETPAPSRIQQGDTIGQVRMLRDYIHQGGSIIGAGDIYNVPLQSPLTLAGILCTVLMTLIDTEKRPVVHKTVVIVPPLLETEGCDEALFSEITKIFPLVTHCEMEPPVQAWLKRRLQLITAPDQRISSVLDIIRAQPECTSIIVTEASTYRDDKIEPYIAEGASTPLQAEDVWVPQLHALGSAAIMLAQECKLYVALDANQFSPNRKVLSDLLHSIENCGVMGSCSEDSPDTILATRVDQWDAWIREGHLGKALRDIEQLPVSLDSHKSFLRIQVLHKAGHFPQALQAIRQEIELVPELDAQTRLKLARIAQNANASILAIEILSPAISKLKHQEELESALNTARDAGTVQLADEIADRLQVLFPKSPGVFQHQLRSLLSKRDYTAAATIMAEESESEAEFYRVLAQFLTRADTPDYTGLIALAGSDSSLADAYRMACVDDALSRKLVHHAFQLAIPLPTTPDQTDRGERLLLRAIEQILLLVDKDRELPVGMDGFQDAFLVLIGRLAQKPEKQALRGRLTQLIQPQVAGRLGLAITVFTMLNLAAKPIRLEKKKPLNYAGLDWLQERQSFIETVFRWMEDVSPIVIGRTTLPEALLTVPADELVSAISNLLELLPLESEEDVDACQKWLALAAAVTPHSSNPDYDLQLMRLVASRFASSGRTQIARDLVEQMLLNSTATPRRRRLGWFAMADVYHHCHNHLEAFLAMSCALAADNAGDEEQIFHEITCMARLLRDTGFHNDARSLLQKGKVLLQRMGRLNAYSHRLDTIDLQIRQKTLPSDGSEKAVLEVLLGDAVRNAAEVLEHNDNVEPVAALLGQLLRHARAIGCKIPGEASATFDKLLERIRGVNSSVIGAMSAVAPSAEELLSMISIARSTRYSDDVGYDMHNAVIAACRSLGNDDYISDSIHTSFALEILADRGVGVPGWDEASEPPPPPQHIDEPAKIACLISLNGISVVQVGFDSSGHLVRVSIVDGNIEVPVRESGDLMLEERFDLWAETYPFAYGINESTVNLFYTTTSNLRLSGLPQGPVVIVADVRFQPFPPNLLYVDEVFAGRKQAMAMTPSLSWLQAAISRGMIGDGRFCSWISTAIDTSDSQTLSMISERLEPTFSQHNFLVDNGPRLPSTFAGASLAVIAAHGGVHPEGRYFQVVSDEGTLKVTARDLANALRNVGIVILFVCSGGRADKHPGAHTALGLAKDILDRGCAAVIASPWPLDSRVPSHWLPTFLDHWTQGKSLIEANFLANKEVDLRFSHDPARGLAMTILGNPLLRRN